MIANARDPLPHVALAAIDICGCTGWISVLGYGHDADAYRQAAREAKAGFRIEQVIVDEWRMRGWHCADHPDGPPWWKGRGAKTKRPATWPVPETVALGL